MSGKEEFTLTVKQCRVVQQHREKIMGLFGVYVRLPDLALFGSSGNEGSSSGAGAAAPVWVEISGEKSSAMKAKVSLLPF